MLLSGGASSKPSLISLPLTGLASQARVLNDLLVISWCCAVLIQSGLSVYLVQPNGCTGADDDSVCGWR